MVRHQAEHGVHAIGRTSRRTTRHRGTGNHRASDARSATPWPGRAGQGLLGPVAHVDLDEARCGPHPQPERLGDGGRRLPGPLQRRGVDGRRVPWSGRRSARPPPPPAPAPSRDRCSPRGPTGQHLARGGRGAVAHQEHGGRRGSLPAATGRGVGSRRIGLTAARAAHRRLCAVGSNRAERDSLAKVQREVAACRRCPRLVSWREEVARTGRPSYAGQVYWGRGVPGFGDPRRRPGDRRPGPGGARRQPHRPDVHRGPVR